MKHLRKFAPRAFTLVEVLLALFVFTFGLLGLLGVMAGLLQSVSVIEEKHQTADLSAMLQEGLRYDLSTNKTKTFDKIYEELMAKPQVFLCYTVHSDLTKIDKRETKIVPVRTGIPEQDFQNLSGPISKIFARPSISYRSVKIETSGSFTKITKWDPAASNSPDPYLTVDAYVYILERPATTAELDVTESFPTNLRPARRFSITLVR